MSDPNWEKLKEIFHAAVALAPRERSAFLDQACGENVTLRSAAESLLQSHEETSNFVDAPAYHAVAEMLVGDGDLRLGQLIAQYRITSLIGMGGMGKVYLAEDTRLKRNVALKVLPMGTARDEVARKRLIREAQSAAALDHPNICAIHEVGEAEGTTYIAMQYVAGETLDVLLTRRQLTCDESLAFAAQMADALAEAHSRNVIHRDIKPANLMVTTRGQIKILDFGLAKILTDRGMLDTEAETQSLVTEAGTIVGTVPYMSPEQVKGEQLDVRSDIFSFGAVVYEMFSGKQPFQAKTAAEIISAILTKQPVSLASYSIVLPPGLDELLRKCLEKDRGQRYKTMREVAMGLETVRRTFENRGAVTQSLDDGEPTAIEPRRKSFQLLAARRSRLFLAGLAILVILATVYALFLKRPGSIPAISDQSVNSVAYDYYLRGKVNVASETKESNATGIKFLEQSVAADPNLAQAWAELARGYIIRSFQFAPNAEKKKLMEDAEVAVAKALALNPNLPEGHFARGQLLWTPAKGFPHEQAIQSYKRALFLNPNLDETHHQLAMVYSHIGMFDKAQAEVEQALAINPANTLARFRLGVIKLYQGKYEEAVAIFKNVPHEANPALLDRTIATALFQLGRTQEASDIVEEYLRAYPNDEGGNVTSVKAMLLAKDGKEREAEETIQRAVEIGKGFGHFHHTAYNIASAYALLNKPEPAVKWLQATADDGMPCYPLFENDDNLNNLRKDLRFITFMAKLKPQWERYTAAL